MSDNVRDITRPLRLVAAVLGVALVLMAGLAWLNRKALVREALTGWLQSKGVPAEAVVESFGPSRFVGRLVVGDPASPDFRADRIDVRYHLGLGGLEVRSVVLSRPQLRASLRDGMLHVGALDPLIEDFLSRPPQPDAAKPRVQIDDGVMVLATDFGPIRISADALVEDAILQRLRAVTDPTRLRGDGFDLNLGRGELKTITRAGRIDVELAAPLATAQVGPAQLSDGHATLIAHLPYPDLQRKRGDGAVVGAATLTAARASTETQTLDAVVVKAGFSGEARGWIPDLAVRGKATASLQANGGQFAGGRANGLRLAVVSEDLAWTRKGGDRLSGGVKLTGDAAGLTAGDFRIRALTAAFAGQASASAAGVGFALDGSVAGQGAWSGLDPVRDDDGASIVALKRAARDFRISAPALHVSRAGAGATDRAVTLGLKQPVTLIAATGGRARLHSLRRLTVSGGGLPDAELGIANFQAGPNPSADVDLTVAGLSAGPLVGGRVSAAGRARLAGGDFSFTARRCVAVAAERLEFGENDIEDVAGGLCPNGGPIFALANNAWRVAGRVRGARASAPFLQARLEDGGAVVRASGRNGRSQATLTSVAGRLADTAPELRFNPLTMSGEVGLSGDAWTADLAFRRPGGPQIAVAQLKHDGRRGVGGVTIDTGELAFAEGQLQPIDLSPLAAAVGSPATGKARFKGRFDWSPDGATSAGTLTVPDLDFKSPAGAVHGLSGEIAFTSLAPLTAAPGQELRIETVDAVVPLTRLRARFALADQILQIEGGEANVGGGRIRVETLEIPLTPDAPIRGVLHLEGVQLHDLFEASPFGDKVDFDAVVSGRVPFEALGDRIRVTGGELKADRPGRISIDRAALTGLEAGEAAEAPGAPVDPNATFTGFAYQALENLAFDKLEATIMSRDDGRLGVLFHITGRHDPPKKQTLRLPLMDLIQRRFLGRNLPLPSGTGVNLTLDTTLNLDDLLADYAEYQRARSSGPVQP